MPSPVSTLVAAPFGQVVERLPAQCKDVPVDHDTNPLDVGLRRPTKLRPSHDLAVTYTTKVPLTPAVFPRSMRARSAGKCESPDADAVLLSRAVRPCGQQSLRAEDLRLSEALRPELPAPAYLRCERGAARPASLRHGW